MKSHVLNLVIALAVTTAAFACYGFWYAAIVAKSTAVADIQNQIVAKTATADRVASTRATLSEIAGDEAMIQSHFIPDTEVVAFIDGLETQGEKQGTTVSVRSVSTGTGAQPTFLLSLTINGSFGAVMRTIGIIEYAPYYISISELSLSQGDKSIWQADLKLLVGSIHAATSTP
ncbi:MAG: hypothetical protein WCS97_02015 [Candidatus Paceibacterota bacterium]|jgi:hypothetical protein